MEEQQCPRESNNQDKDTKTLNKWSEHCKTFIVRDAHGAIKELVFPRALDLDRPKRERTIFSSRQLGCLEKEFKQNQYLVGKERSVVAKRLGLSETQVKVWFQNRRTKHKKDSERCGDGSHFQAESKAARNVLKLLEYKTAINYNTLITQPSAHLDSYRNLHSHSMGYVGLHSSSKHSDHLGRLRDTNLKQHDTLSDHSHIDTTKLGTETCHEMSTETTRIRLGLEKEFCNKDIQEKDIALQRTQPDTNVECCQASNAFSLQQNNNSPENASRITTNPAVVNDASYKLMNPASNTRLPAERLEYPNKVCTSVHILKDNSIPKNVMPQNDSTLSEKGHIASGKGEIHEETLNPSKLVENTDLSPICTWLNSHPGLRNSTDEPAQETWRNVQAFNFDNIQYRQETLFPQGCFPENSACSDNELPHNLTSNINNSHLTNGGLMPTAHHNRSMEHYLSKIMLYPSHVDNARLTCQTLMTAPSPSLHHLPFTNIKQNYYAPATYGAHIHEPPISLQILQHMPVGSTCGGHQQRPHSVYAMGTSQASFLTQPTLHGLSALRHGYHSNPSWN